MNCVIIILLYADFGKWFEFYDTVFCNLKTKILEFTKGLIPNMVCLLDGTMILYDK